MFGFGCWKKKKQDSVREQFLTQNVRKSRAVYEIASESVCLSLQGKVGQ